MIEAQIRSFASCPRAIVGEGKRSVASPHSLIHERREGMYIEGEMDESDGLASILQLILQFHFIGLHDP
jgi:hypothetical protein